MAVPDAANSAQGSHMLLKRVSKSSRTDCVSGSASIRSSVTSAGMLPGKSYPKSRQAAATVAVRAGSLVRTTRLVMQFGCLSVPIPMYQYKGGALGFGAGVRIRMLQQTAGLPGAQQDDGRLVGVASPRPPSDTRRSSVFLHLCLVVHAHDGKRPCLWCPLGLVHCPHADDKSCGQ